MHEVLEAYIVAQMLNDNVNVVTHENHYSMWYEVNCIHTKVSLYSEEIHLTIESSQTQYYAQLFLSKNNLNYKIPHVKSAGIQKIFVHFSSLSEALNILIKLEDFILSYKPLPTSCPL